MAKHLALHKNIQFWTVTFWNIKQAYVPFIKQFNKKPSISWSENDSSSFPKFKQDVTTLWFTIKLQSNWNGSLDRMAIEK